jgi:Transposase DDE domain group 1
MRRAFRVCGGSKCAHTHRERAPRVPNREPHRNVSHGFRIFASRLIGRRRRPILALARHRSLQSMTAHVELARRDGAPLATLDAALATAASAELRWTRLSCRSFAANAVRLQLHALAYNVGNFLRTLAPPEPIKDWSLTSLMEKLIRIGAKVVSHYIAFQMTEVAIPRNPFASILLLIAELRPVPRCIDIVVRSVPTRFMKKRRETCLLMTES